jgi:hypothetical protein
VDEPENQDIGVTGTMRPSTTGWFDGNGRYGYVKPDIFTDSGGKKFGERISSISGPRRDTSYYLMARDFFGVGAHVPVTAAFNHPKDGHEMSVIIRVTDAEPFNRSSDHQDILKGLHSDGTLDKLAATDFIMGNPDRHCGNFLITPNKAPFLHLIDNTMALDYRPTGRQAFPDYIHDFKDVEWHPSASEWIRALSAEKLAGSLSSFGIPSSHVREATRRLLYLQRSMNYAGTTKRQSYNDYVSVPKKGVK